MKTLLYHRCSSPLCPFCSNHKGHIIRDYLYRNADKFVFPRLLTLTVDMSNFSDGLQAYDYVKNNKFIPRLLRYLQIKNWFCVLEFQENGAPHWHLLIDSQKKVDVIRLRNLWQNKFGIGKFINVTFPKGLKSSVNGSYVIYIVNYITKYILKGNHKLPLWLLNCKHSIRLYSSSKSLGAIYPQSKHESSVSQHKERKPKTYLTKLSTCGKILNVYETDFINNKCSYKGQIYNTLEFLPFREIMKVDENNNVTVSSVISDVVFLTEYNKNNSLYISQCEQEFLKQNVAK